MAERGLEDQSAPVRDRDRAARLFGQPHLVLDPARQVVERRGQPAHALALGTTRPASMRI